MCVMETLSGTSVYAWTSASIVIKNSACLNSIWWQRWCRRFKSGQATANKRSLMHVHGGGGGGEWGSTTGAGGDSRQARLRSRTTASNGMRHIASSCTLYTHLATHGPRPEQPDWRHGLWVVLAVYNALSVKNIQ